VLLYSDEIFNLNDITSLFINSSLKKSNFSRVSIFLFTGLNFRYYQDTPENIVGDTLIFLQKNRQNSKNTIK
jgi:hypothetical protein